MQTKNVNQNLGSNASGWVFLAAYSLSELMWNQNKSDEPTAGLLFQSLQELSIPPEYVEDIRMTLTRFAKEARLQFEQGRVEQLGQIRVYCQKKRIDDANSAKTSRPYRSEGAIHPSAKKMNGGWGYFLIERSTARNSVDLYLYKEGE